MKIFILILLIILILVVTIRYKIISDKLVVYDGVELLGVIFGGESTASAIFGGGEDKIKDIKKFPRSKFEAHIASIFEKITKKPFPSVYPSWLVYKGRHLELDGYNAELKIAFEAQGPLHTKFYADKEKYKSYHRRLESDRAKLELCEKNGVKLILIDVVTPKQVLEQYIYCRLYDIGFIKGEKPYNYIPEQIVEPYTNWIYEGEMASDS